jgi:hypothetical protein
MTVTHLSLLAGAEAGKPKADGPGKLGITSGWAAIAGFDVSPCVALGAFLQTPSIVITAASGATWVPGDVASSLAVGLFTAACCAGD